MTRFEKALAHALRWEGGLVNHPADPGGWTRFGISLRWLEGQGIDIDGDGDVDAADIRALTLAKAHELYHRFVWDAAYDQLRDDAVAVYVFDMDINMGERRAHLIAQQAAVALGATLQLDGRLGPRSVAAMNLLPQATLLAKMREMREAFYRGLAKRKPALAVFLRGWLNRAAA